MYIAGRLEVRTTEHSTRTHVYISDDSVKPVRNINMPLSALKAHGYRIINTFEHRGNAFLLLEHEEMEA